jgi:hypothetical protein
MILLLLCYGNRRLDRCRAQSKDWSLVVRAEKEKLIAQTLATNSDQKAASVAEREADPGQSSG